MPIFTVALSFLIAIVFLIFVKYQERKEQKAEEEAKKKANVNWLHKRL